MVMQPEGRRLAVAGGRPRFLTPAQKLAAGACREPQAGSLRCSWQRQALQLPLQSRFRHGRHGGCALRTPHRAGAARLLPPAARDAVPAHMRPRLGPAVLHCYGRQIHVEPGSPTLQQASRVHHCQQPEALHHCDCCYYSRPELPVNALTWHLHRHQQHPHLHLHQWHQQLRQLRGY